MEEIYKDHIVFKGNDDLFPSKDNFDELKIEQLVELFRHDDYIPYSQFLRTDLWKSKRTEILDRDGFKCQKCGAYETDNIQIRNPQTNEVIETKIEWSQIQKLNWVNLCGEKKTSIFNAPVGKPDKPYNIQVHHKKYRINHLPWDYLNDDLISLCNYCHKEEHENNKILVIDENEQILKDFKFCERCGGTGYLPEYKHVQNGICFKCRGEKTSIKIINKRIS